MMLFEKGKRYRFSLEKFIEYNKEDQSWAVKIDGKEVLALGMYTGVVFTDDGNKFLSVNADWCEEKEEDLNIDKNINKIMGLISSCNLDKQEKEKLINFVTDLDKKAKGDYNGEE